MAVVFPKGPEEIKARIVTTKTEKPEFPLPVRPKSVKHANNICAGTLIEFQSQSTGKNHYGLVAVRNHEYCICYRVTRSNVSIRKIPELAIRNPNIFDGTGYVNIFSNMISCLEDNATVIGMLSQVEYFDVLSCAMSAYMGFFHEDADNCYIIDKPVLENPIKVLMQAICVPATNPSFLCNTPCTIGTERENEKEDEDDDDAISHDGDIFVHPQISVTEEHKSEEILPEVPEEESGKPDEKPEAPKEELKEEPNEKPETPKKEPKITKPKEVIDLATRIRNVYAYASHDTINRVNSIFDENLDCMVDETHMSIPSLYRKIFEGKPPKFIKRSKFNLTKNEFIFALFQNPDTIQEVFNASKSNVRYVRYIYGNIQKRSWVAVSESERNYILDLYKQSGDISMYNFSRLEEVQEYYKKMGFSGARVYTRVVGIFHSAALKPNNKDGGKTRNKTNDIVHRYDSMMTDDELAQVLDFINRIVDDGSIGSYISDGIDTVPFTSTKIRLIVACIINTIIYGDTAFWYTFIENYIEFAEYLNSIDDVYSICCNGRRPRYGNNAGFRAICNLKVMAHFICADSEELERLSKMDPDEITISDIHPFLKVMTFANSHASSLINFISDYTGIEVSVINRLIVKRKKFSRNEVLAIISGSNN